MGIRKKAFFIFCFFLATFIASFLFYEYHIDNLMRQAKLSNFAWVMLEDILEVRRHEKNFILRGDGIFRGNRTYTDLLRTHLQHLYREAKQYKAIANNPEEIKIVDQIIEKLRLYDNHVHQFIEEHKSRDIRQETEYLVESGRAVVELIQDLKDTAAAQMNELLITIDSVQSRQWIFLLISFAVATIIFWFMFRTLVVPVQRLHALNREIAREGVIREGQLHSVDELVRSLKGKDQIAELARGYREMMVRCSNSYIGLQKKMEEVEQLYKLKSEFTSTVSHELRTPLTAIKEGISLVLDGSTGEISEEQKEFLGIAHRNVDRLGRLINHVLDFSKMTAKKVELNKERVQINDIVSQVVDIYRLVVEKKGLLLKVDVSATDELFVECDPDRINQVITNLLNNAVKFTDQGMIKVKTLMDPSTNSVRVMVQDTGPGIAREDITRLFQPFSQVGRGKETTGGTGLGLAICREIVEQSGGKIWVDSVQGAGAAFYFSLPIEERRRSGR